MPLPMLILRPDQEGSLGAFIDQWKAEHARVAALAVCGYCKKKLEEDDMFLAVTLEAIRNESFCRAADRAGIHVVPPKGELWASLLS